MVHISVVAFVQQPTIPPNSKGETMNCYKCYSTKELGIKNKFRDGRPRSWVCKACRREEYLSRKPEVEKQLPMSDQDAWISYARGVNHKIALKYKEVYIIR